jgi:hypothetical protein
MPLLDFPDTDCYLDDAPAAMPARPRPRARAANEDGGYFTPAVIPDPPVFSPDPAPPMSAGVTRLTRSHRTSAAGGDVGLEWTVPENSTPWDAVPPRPRPSSHPPRNDGDRLDQYQPAAGLWDVHAGVYEHDATHPARRPLARPHDAGDLALVFAAIPDVSQAAEVWQCDARPLPPPRRNRPPGDDPQQSVLIDFPRWQAAVDVEAHPGRRRPTARPDQPGDVPQSVLIDFPLWQPIDAAAKPVLQIYRTGRRDQADAIPAVYVAAAAEEEARRLFAPAQPEATRGHALPPARRRDAGGAALDLTLVSDPAQIAAVTIQDARPAPVRVRYHEQPGEPAWAGCGVIVAATPFRCEAGQVYQAYAAAGDVRSLEGS